MFHALNAFAQAIGLLVRPGIRGYVLLPLGISAAIMGPGVGISIAYADDLATRFTEWLPSYLSFLETLLVPLLYVVSVLLGAWLFAFLAMLLMGPFLGPLSARVERHITGQSPTPGERGLVRDVGAAIARELHKYLIYLPRVLLVLLMTVIPVVNGLAPIAWFLLGAWIMALQFFDYPLENRHLPLRATRGLLAQHRVTTLTFGGITAALLAVPLLSIVVLPVATIAAAVLYCERLSRSPALD